MSRAELINRLVNRKMVSKENIRAFCICMVSRPGPSATPARPVAAKK